MLARSSPILCSETALFFRIYESYHLESFLESRICIYNHTIRILELESHNLESTVLQFKICFRI